MHPPTGLIGPHVQPGTAGPPIGPAPGRPGHCLSLLTTDAFVAELLSALEQARTDVAVQLMTFDGDQSGLAVARALVAAAGRGARVRLLVDCFALRFVSDRPVRHREVVAEYRRTQVMYGELAEAGVAVRFTHPNGPLNLFALARNHKKLYVIDDDVYLGGVNVSDHNFAWHDVMVRVTDPALRRTVLDDFDASFAGRRIGRDRADATTGTPSSTVSRNVDATGTLALVTNDDLRHAFDELLAGARRRVVIASPYAVDRRVAGRLEARPDLDRRLLIAERNNFWCLELITPYLAARMTRAGVNLASFGRFSHAKFLLVDDDALLIGSSNFGRHSLTCNQEIGLIIRDRAFIAEFEQRLLADLTPLNRSSSRLQRLTGRVSSAIIDLALIAYARAIAPHVPPLAPATQRFPGGI